MTRDDQETTGKKLLGRAEVVCWVVGIALVAFYFAARADGEIQRREAISAFMVAAAAEPSVANTGTPAAVHEAPAALTYGAPNEAHWSRGRIRAYDAAQASAGRAAGLPVAVLRIRRVGLEVPVYAADSAYNMNRGAVLVSGTAAPDTTGNTAIAAHRDGYFRALKNVVVGDVLSVQTLWRLRRYRVISLEIVRPTDIAVLRATSRPSVTLITCYPFYFVGSAPRRYIVRAVALGSTGRLAGPSAGRSSPLSGTEEAHAAGRTGNR